MSKDEIIRSWRSGAFEQGGEPHQVANPVGPVELSDEDLGFAVGADDVTAGTVCSALSVVSALTAVSQLIHCWDSVAHGTCSGWSIGCC